MNRRDFLKTMVSAVVFAIAPHTPAVAAPSAQRPAWDELPAYPCREIISQATTASLLEWWTKYGRGCVAWQYRDVPRRHVLYVLNQRWVIPFEHVGR